MRALIWIFVPLAACTADATCAVDGEPEVGVMKSLYFSRAEGDISDGFDLDGAITADGAATGCGVPDYVGSDGTTGVDNALARILPALDLTEAVAVEGIIQNAINSGELLFMYQVDGLDDPWNDDCVDLTILRGAGAPTLGTDGKLESGQTFDRDPEVTPVVAASATVVDGVLVAAPLELQIPITIFDVNINLDIHDASFRMERQESGDYVGMFGGGVVHQVLMDVATGANVDSRIAGILQGLLDGNADLVPDAAGRCEQLSATLKFESTSAFLFDEISTED
jgi:hypothetical protein